ncbi:MAG: hypothetical protein ACR2FN_06865 [Chitinophagaceae bacterium]
MSEKDSVTTTDHKKIKQWAEERKGKPVKIKTGAKEGEGILRIDFPGYSGDDSFEEISWDEWFEIFDEKQLAFLYQDETSKGKKTVLIN